MATTTGNRYDHIAISDGSDITLHYLTDNRYPDVPNDTTKFLRGDGTWSTIEGGNAVIVSPTQPTAEDNKIWVDSDTVTETEVPTMDEFNELSSAINERPKITSVSESAADLYVADANGNVLAQFASGHVKTKNFDSSVLPTNCEYMFSGNNLLLSYGYNNTYDAVIVMNEGRANGLFDFSAFKLKTKGTPLNEASLTNVWTSVTDMHGPFQFLATSNADGYYADATDPGFVGGNHTLNQMGAGFETATSKYVRYFADGVPVSSGYGKCTNFEIRWANDVQAYNTVKEGGGGRSCLTEYHDMIFDGVQFNEKIMLVPSEEIRMKLWYGLQTVGYGSTYTNIRFIDGTNRGSYTATSATSGNNTTSGIVLTGASHSLEMTVDTGYDLGKRTYYSGTSGAFTSSNKAYFYIIGTSVTMAANDAYFLRGSYRFYPTIIQ